MVHLLEESADRDHKLASNALSTRVDTRFGLELKIYHNPSVRFSMRMAHLARVGRPVPAND